MDMKMRLLLAFLRLSVRGVCSVRRLYFVLGSSSVQRDRGETSLHSGVRDGVHCRVDGGALRYRDRGRRRRTRRGGEFHLQENSELKLKG